ncbi:MAG TPA: hypothetical protein VML55_02040, partial [Planctomycetaceae bacterium]|nr:hypothetical protein [Planctomycetaceae bacterium]
MGLLFDVFEELGLLESLPEEYALSANELEGGGPTVRQSAMAIIADTSGPKVDQWMDLYHTDCDEFHRRASDWVDAAIEAGTMHSNGEDVRSEGNPRLFSDEADLFFREPNVYVPPPASYGTLWLLRRDIIQCLGT